MNQPGPNSEHLARARQELTEWLDKYQQLRIGDSSWTYRSFAGLVAAHGTFYPPAPWPLTEPQIPGQCFKAARQCAELTGWAYAEGFVLAAAVAPFSAFEHAWCITSDGTVADAALPDGFAEGYFGNALSHGFRREQQKQRDTDAVFTSDPS